MIVRSLFRLARIAALGVVGLLICASTVGAQTPTLAWNANLEPDLTGYVVEYGETAGSPSTTVDVGNVTSRQFTGLQSGRTYYFRVRAYNTAGQQSGPSTELAYATPVAPSQPAVGSVTPSSGPTSGGTVITITGSSFVSGATVYVGGASATGVTFVSSTELRATTPPGTAGPQALQVVNPGGLSATLTNGFSYTSTSVRPSYGSVSPTSGPTSGGTVLTISGSSFVSGATVRIGGVNATSVTFISATQLRATTPPGTIGGKSVQIINPGGLSASRANAFYYTSGSSAQPAIGAVSPSSGSTSGGTVITITGSNFVSGATVSIGGVNATSVTFTSATELRATTPPGAAGAQAVQVVNPGGLSATLSNGFSYTSSTSVRPSFGSVSPTSGPTSGGTVLTISGSSFVSGAIVRVGGVDATSVTFISATQLRATTPPGTIGGKSVQIINPGGLSASRGNGFYYTGSSSATAASQTASALRVVTDIDGDGLPTAWEDAFGLASDIAHGDNGAEGDPDADGVSNAAEYLRGTHPRGLVRRFLAEGASTADVQTRFVIANPTSARAAVVMSFFDASGRPARVALAVPARSRRTVDPSSIPELNGKAFATELESDQVVALDRSMWSPAGFGPQIQTAAEEPATRWRLATASTQQFDLFYLLQNPNDIAADVAVGYQSAEGAPAVTKTYHVPPHGRLTIAVDGEDPALAAADVTSEVISMNAPIVVEQSMYAPIDGRTALAHGAMGSDLDHAAARAEAARWLFAEAGQVDAGGEAPQVVVSNATAMPLGMRVTLLFEDADEQAATFEVGGSEELALTIAQAFPAAAGRPVSVLIESVDPTVPGALLVTRK
jgi:hypothetical protein